MLMCLFSKFWIHSQITFLCNTILFALPRLPSCLEFCPFCRLLLSCRVLIAWPSLLLCCRCPLTCGGSTRPLTKSQWFSSTEVPSNSWTRCWLSLSRTWKTFSQRKRSSGRTPPASNGHPATICSTDRHLGHRCVMVQIWTPVFFWCGLFEMKGYSALHNYWHP